MFSLRILTINYYLTKPDADCDDIYSDFRRDEVKQVPVIRVFGTTPEGQLIYIHTFLMQQQQQQRKFLIGKSFEQERPEIMFACS